MPDDVTSAPLDPATAAAVAAVREMLRPFPYGVLPTKWRDALALLVRHAEERGRLLGEVVPDLRERLAVEADVATTYADRAFTAEVERDALRSRLAEAERARQALCREILRHPVECAGISPRDCLDSLRAWAEGLIGKDGAP